MIQGHRDSSGMTLILLLNAFILNHFREYPSGKGIKFIHIQNSIIIRFLVGSSSPSLLWPFRVFSISKLGYLRAQSLDLSSFFSDALPNLMPLKTNYALIFPKFLSALPVSPRNSRLIYPTPYLISPLRCLIGIFN